MLPKKDRQLNKPNGHHVIVGPKRCQKNCRIVTIPRECPKSWTLLAKPARMRAARQTPQKESARFPPRGATSCDRAELHEAKKAAHEGRLSELNSQQQIYRITIQLPPRQ
jgi:hypothetical protein